MNKFKYILKELRKEKKLSQAEFAKEFNIGQTTVSGWETGYREPDLDTLIKLSKYFGVTTDYLLGIDF